MNKLTTLFIVSVCGVLLTFEDNTFGLKKCKSEDNWSIHGYWVNDEFCSNKTLNVTNLNPIIDDMNKYWFSCFEDNEKFWDHEWRKHGSCYSTNELKYFNDTLQLFFKNKETFNEYCDEHYSKKSTSCDVTVKKSLIFEQPSFVVHKIFDSEY